MPVQVNRQNCLCARRDCGLYQRGIERIGLWLNINKHRGRADQQDDVGRRGKAKCRRNYFIAWANAMCQQRQMERRRT